MALAAFDSFTLMNQLQKEVNRVFRPRVVEGRSGQNAAVTGDWAPLVDINEESGHYVIYADVPGIDPKEIEITMENGILTLRGTRAAQTSSPEHGYQRRERPAGLFCRRFVLPDTADAEGISAQGKNGVLQITIPKRQQAQPRRIQVES